MHHTLYVKSFNKYFLNKKREHGLSVAFYHLVGCKTPYVNYVPVLTLGISLCTESGTAKNIV